MAAPASLESLSLHRLLRRLPGPPPAASLARELGLPSSLAAQLAAMGRAMQDLLGAYTVTLVNITSDYLDEEGNLLPGLMSDHDSRRTIHIRQDVTAEGDKVWTVGLFMVFGQETTLNAFPASPVFSTRLTSGARACWTCGAPTAGREFLDSRGRLVMEARHIGATAPCPSECGGLTSHTFEIDPKSKNGYLVWSFTRDVVSRDRDGKLFARKVTTETRARPTRLAPHCPPPTCPAVRHMARDGEVCVVPHAALTLAILDTVSSGQARSLMEARLLTLVTALCPAASPGPAPSLAWRVTTELVWELEILDLWRLLVDLPGLGDAVGVMLRAHTAHGW